MKKKAEIIRTIAVIGIGRVGLPLSLVLADEGYHVVGIDTDPAKKQTLEKKHMPFKERKAAALLKKHYGKTFTMGTINNLSSCQAVIICIGTFLKDNFTPDTSALYALLDDIIPSLQKNTLIILRSTVYPRETEKVFAYLQKKLHQKFSLVYAPERIAEGFAVEELYEIPQMIGTFDKKSYEKAAPIFKKFAPKVMMTDSLSAELAKLALNTHRYANFAIANELMMITQFYQRDIHTVLDLANTGYKRGTIPGPGFAAGPCLVKDSFFLRHGTPYNTLITGAFSINDMVPKYIIENLEALKKLQKKKVALLGLAFKKDIDDDRGSLSLPLKKMLEKKGASVAVHDPYLGKNSIAAVLKHADVIIIAVNHKMYMDFTIKKLQKMVGKESLVCDIWNTLGTNKIFFHLPGKKQKRIN